ncbi:MAG: hypothetical protein AB7G93_03200 [Bdellovibrionales bacterium]
MWTIKSKALLVGALIGLSACSKGGQLTLEPGAKKSSKGSPYVMVNQGGKALVVQQGQTPSTGVHGWISIQSVSSDRMVSGQGHQMFMNKPGTN